MGEETKDLSIGSEVNVYEHISSNSLLCIYIICSVKFLIIIFNPLKNDCCLQGVSISIKLERKIIFGETRNSRGGGTLEFDIFKFNLFSISSIFVLDLRVVFSWWVHKIGIFKFNIFSHSKFGEGGYHGGFSFFWGGSIFNSIFFPIPLKVYQILF